MFLHTCFISLWLDFICDVKYTFDLYKTILNTYLLQIPPKSDWWNEGLATYVTDRCTNNTQYYGREGLTLLFKHGTNVYNDGLILQNV